VLLSGSTIINNDFQVGNMAKKSLGAEELVAIINNLTDIEWKMVIEIYWKKHIGINWSEGGV